MASPWSKLESVHRPMEALVLKSFLEGHGIPCMLVGLYASVVEPLPLQPIEVQVPRDRLQEAKALLEALRRDALASDREERGR